MCLFRTRCLYTFLKLDVQISECRLVVPRLLELLWYLPALRLL